MNVKSFWQIVLGVGLPYVDMSCSKNLFDSIVEFQPMVDGAVAGAILYASAM
jgi:hypothetical protein